MKKLFLYTLTTAFILTGASYAMADNHERPDKGAMFEKLDTNSDGSISMDEFAAKKMKHKKDKKEKHGKMIEKIDQNGDGVLSEDEFISKSKERFAELDANKDGKVTAEEAKTYHDAKRAEMKEKRAERHEKASEKSAE